MLLNMTLLFDIIFVYTEYYTKLNRNSPQFIVNIIKL